MQFVLQITILVVEVIIVIMLELCYKFKKKMFNILAVHAFYSCL